ncbi:MAG: hypothetical protein LBS81_05165 [Endomicrobium sp.]|jgi:lauroyl/myristoyl acyltransferase|nr:hypothetical protein [Endomicrobium sp.]
MSAGFTKIRRKIYYYCAFIFSKIVLVLPYKFSVGTLSAFFGRIAYYVTRDVADIAVKNLKKCFPEKSEKEIIKITREIFCNETKSFLNLQTFRE